MAEGERSNRGIWIATALVVVLGAGGFLAFRHFVQAKEVETAPKQEAVAAPDAGHASVNLAEGDAILKDSARELSTEELLARWLATPDLVRRLVGATFQVGRGESPRTLLDFLRPEGTFTVDEEEETAPVKGGKAKAKKAAKKKRAKRLGKGESRTKKVAHYFITDASYARYDAIARVLDSIDTTKLGALYAKLSPYIDAAVREAAPPGSTPSKLFHTAVVHLADTPITDTRHELVPMGTGVDYAFKDPKLEGLTHAQKHLLRMGPANARTVLKKLQAFDAALFSAK